MKLFIEEERKRAVKKAIVTKLSTESWLEVDSRSRELNFKFIMEQSARFLN